MTGDLRSWEAEAMVTVTVAVHFLSLDWREHGGTRESTEERGSCIGIQEATPNNGPFPQTETTPPPNRAREHRLICSQLRGL